MLANALSQTTTSTHRDTALSYRRTFEPTTLAEHLSCVPLRGVDARDHLFSEGDARTHLYRVETGAVCLYKLLSDGRRQIVGFACAGDLIGLGSGSAHQFSAQATKRARVRSLPWNVLQQASRRHAGLGLELFEVTCAELAAAHDMLLTTGQRTAIERVAAFLLAMSRRAAGRGGDETVVELPMTRSDIGDFLGLTIETVSRTFTKLRQLRVIELEQSVTVRLLDTVALQELAKGSAEQ